jgi:hypothetical protein
VTLAALTNRIIFSSIGGFSLMGIFGVAHNFIHHKENLFSNLIKFTGFSFNDFQIMHCLSHHPFPNTELDMEITALQPLVYWIRSRG